MPGGLLNLIAVGNQNVILNGNPSKTFFKTVFFQPTHMPKLRKKSPKIDRCQFLLLF